MWGYGGNTKTHWSVVSNHASMWGGGGGQLKVHNEKDVIWGRGLPPSENCRPGVGTVPGRRRRRRPGSVPALGLVQDWILTQKHITTRPGGGRPGGGGGRFSLGTSQLAAFILFTRI